MGRDTRSRISSLATGLRLGPRNRVEDLDLARRGGRAPARSSRPAVVVLSREITEHLGGTSGTARAGQSSSTGREPDHRQHAPGGWCWTERAGIGRRRPAIRSGTRSRCGLPEDSRSRDDQAALGHASILSPWSMPERIGSGCGLCWRRRSNWRGKPSDTTGRCWCRRWRGGLPRVDRASMPDHSENSRLPRHHVVRALARGAREAEGTRGGAPCQELRARHVEAQGERAHRTRRVRGVRDHTVRTRGHQCESTLACDAACTRRMRRIASVRRSWMGEANSEVSHAWVSRTWIAAARLLQRDDLGRPAIAFQPVHPYGKRHAAFLFACLRPRM